MNNLNLVDPLLEIQDPNPDIHNLFVYFNDLFFYGKLGSVELKWSNRMTLCAGLCRYKRNQGCAIVLSHPLLKFRPRKDLIETLLHEMIHALLFVTHNNKDRNGHGPEFLSNMKRINNIANTNITVYHSFHREVDEYRKHWWQCNGTCRNKPPYFGIVKRAMNRAPGPYDFWWKDHFSDCGGVFTKICSPDPSQISKKSQSSPKNIQNFHLTPKSLNDTIEKWISKSSKSFETYENNIVDTRISDTKNNLITNYNKFAITSPIKYNSVNISKSPTKNNLITNYYSNAINTSSNAYGDNLYAKTNKMLKNLHFLKNNSSINRLSDSSNVPEQKKDIITIYLD